MIGGAFEDITDAFIAGREGNVSHGDWNLQWIALEIVSDEELNRRMAIGFDLANVQLSENSVWDITAIEDRDWLTESYSAFPPFDVGPFFIYGSHYDGDVPEGKMGLQIDAATAFGTGEHGTTKGCLQFMLRLKDDGACPWNVLDMGCGSGILAIAAWKLWKTPVLAVDIEDESVRVAKVHQSMNGVADGQAAMSCFAGDGYATSQVQDRKPYDLIVANILAAPLIAMAEECKNVSDASGYVILSGMLREQAEAVREAYEAQNFNFIDRIDIGEWTSLLLQNAAS